MWLEKMLKGDKISFFSHLIEHEFRRSYVVSKRFIKLSLHIIEPLNSGHVVALPLAEPTLTAVKYRPPYSVCLWPTTGLFLTA
jgi:hypothetical protein